MTAVQKLSSLEKLAGLFDRDAGVGTARENKIDKIYPSSLDPYHALDSASYFGRLWGNAENEKDRDIVADYSPNGSLILAPSKLDPHGTAYQSHIVDRLPPDSPLTKKWIDATRRRMAEEGADKILEITNDHRPPAWKRVVDNLMDSGRENQDSFRNSGNVHKRDAFELNQKYLGPLLRNLRPDQKNRLLQRQNIQVLNSRQNRKQIA